MTDKTKPEKRKTFNEEAETRATEFARECLDNVPELESIAVVLTYGVPQDKLPCAIVMGQDGPIHSPTELVNLLGQLSRTFNGQAVHTFQVVQSLARQVQEQHALLDKLNKVIDERKQEIAEIGRPSPPGSPTTGPGA